MNKCADNFENYLEELIDKNGILDTKKLKSLLNEYKFKKPEWLDKY